MNVITLANPLIVLVITLLASSIVLIFSKIKAGDVNE